MPLLKQEQTGHHSGNCSRLKADAHLHQLHVWHFLLLKKISLTYTNKKFTYRLNDFLSWKEDWDDRIDINIYLPLADNIKCDSHLSKCPVRYMFAALVTAMTTSNAGLPWLSCPLKKMLTFIWLIKLLQCRLEMARYLLFGDPVVCWIHEGPSFGTVVQEDCKPHFKQLTSSSTCSLSTSIIRHFSA